MRTTRLLTIFLLAALVCGGAFGQDAAATTPAATPAATSPAPSADSSAAPTAAPAATTATPPAETAPAASGAPATTDSGSADLLAEIARLGTRLDEANATIDELRAEAKDLREKAQSAEEAAQVAQDQAKASDEKLAEAHGKAAAAEESAKAAEAKAATAEEKAAAADAKVAAAEAKTAAAEAKAADAETKAAAAEADAVALKNKLAATEQGAKEALARAQAAEGAAGKAAALESEAARLRDKAASLEARIAELEAERAAISTKLVAWGALRLSARDYPEIVRKGFEGVNRSVGSWKIENGVASQLDPAQYFSRLTLPAIQTKQPTLYSFEVKAGAKGWVGAGLHFFSDQVKRPRGYGEGKSLLVWLTRDAKMRGGPETYLQVYRSDDDVNMGRVLDARIQEGLAAWNRVDVLYDPGTEFVVVAVNGAVKAAYRTFFGIGAGVTVSLRTLGAGVSFRNFEVRR